MIAVLNCYVLSALLTRNAERASEPPCVAEQHKKLAEEEKRLLQQHVTSE